LASPGSQYGGFRHWRNVDDSDPLFADAAAHVTQEFFGGDEGAFNAHLRIVLWELLLDAEEAGELVPNSDTLWQAVREGDPRLRVYYVIDGDTCRLRWIEVDPEWAAAASRADLYF
jgi:hypothetical protein